MARDLTDDLAAVDRPIGTAKVRETRTTWTATFGQPSRTAWAPRDGFDGDRFSPVIDGATHAFHRWVAGRMA